ncbi:hypothetical protein [Actinomyces gerencseriae]|nr:hypothetical protein [Actinomyces gerencseriae]
MGSKVKRLHVTPEATHFSIYDQESYVNENLEIGVAFLEEDL